MSRNLYNLPGALAKAVIFAIEPVGSACMRSRATNANSQRGHRAANKGAQALCMVLEKFTSV